MNRPVLVIGNKNYSSWSMRPWLLLRHFGLDFEEIRIPLSQEGSKAAMATWCPSGKVPVLHHEGVAVWDSLAVCEYVSERLLDGKGWPAGTAQRAQARSICAEMHAGFTELRSHWPMNCRLRRKLEPSPGLARDIARIEAIWTECLAASGGLWLFGGFSIADCFYAPVALRFHSYQPALSEAAQGYVERVLAHPPVREWMAAGRAEKELIAEDEVGFLLGEPDWEKTAAPVGG